MFRYCLYVPLQLLCMILCYLTNWFVVLFADEEGELPRIFKLWQTWDSSLDNHTYVTQDCPSFIRYDFDNYYKEYREPLNGQDKRYVTLIRDFSTKDLLKRYFCRVFWLYRNCAYGFAYYIFGVTVNGREYSSKGHLLYWSNTYHLVYPFSYKNDDPINSHIRNKSYLGWKIKSNKGVHRAMLAFRVSFKFTF